ncbi:hypothetical protein AND_001426 [Anopheles darlingi]|uniref:Uncharacterized protein n=1 Tax=Anopheles darlingi TaxID=43151 RepID=W5JRM2_ANODA|nr:hypothetical protein AND_001426 [Anopheles darlingi]
MNAYEKQQQQQPSLELSSKRYPIATKNRKSKFQFLAGVQEHYERKQEAAKERAAMPKRVNLSVPGTPVCSRYLQSMSSRSSVASSDDESTQAVPPAQELIISSIVLEKFVKDMSTLSSADQLDKPETKSEGNANVQVDGTADDFFKASDARKAYHRTFSEAVGTVGGGEKDPAVKRYFDESASQHTYRRDFSEAYGELGGVKDDPIFSTTDAPSSAATTKKKKRSKPTRQQLISESSSDEDHSGAPELAAKERQRNEFLEELMELKNSKKRMEQELKAFQSKDPSLVTDGQKERVQRFFEESDQSKAYHRSFSEAAQTFGAPPSDPKVREYFTESATRHTYRRDFSEVCGELGANGPATGGESERYKPTVPGTPISSRSLHKLKKHVEEEPELVTPDASASLKEQLAKFNEELEELKLSKPAISLDTKQPPVTDDAPPKPDFCVEQYLSTSNEKRSYARSFSEAAQSLSARPEVKSDTVKSFFDDSSRKGTFRREFSQAYQELAMAPDDGVSTVNDITQPSGGTSADRVAEKDNGASPSLPDNATAVVAESTDERNIVIPGTPVSSRKRSPPKAAVRSDKPIVPEASSRTSGAWDGQRLPARVPLTPQLDVSAASAVTSPTTTTTTTMPTTTTLTTTTMAMIQECGLEEEQQQQ